MASILRRAAALAGLALSVLAAGGALAQEAAGTTVAISRGEARALGAQAIEAGDAGLARDIAQGLIATAPGDRDGWLLLAASEARLGDATASRAAAAEAHRLSTSDEDRYQAARMAALAARAEGRHGLSVWWLRRALLAAPSPEEAARTRADARRVQSEAVWRTDVSLSFTPSDNVNGGSESPYNIVDGLPFVGVISVDGQALSGWVGTVEATASRRLHESERQRTDLEFHLYDREVTLSDEARDKIEEETPEGRPLVGASDFSYRLAEAGLSHRRVVAGTLVGASLTFGAAWSGGDPYYRSAKAGADATRRLGEGRQATLEATVEQRWYDGADTPDLPVSVTVGWSARLPGGDSLGLTAGLAGTWSDNGNAASEAWLGQVSYTLARPVGPARLRASLGYQEVDYADYAVLFPVPGGREDRRTFASIEARMVGWDVGGFVPVVTLTATSTDSNVSRFEGESVGLGFGLRSSF